MSEEISKQELADLLADFEQMSKIIDSDNAMRTVYADLKKYRALYIERSLELEVVKKIEASKERFVARAVAEERERCAQLADKIHAERAGNPCGPCAIAKMVADEIRARGGQ